MDSKQIILIVFTIIAVLVLWYLFNTLGALGFSFSALMGAGLGVGVVVGGLFLYLFVLSHLNSKR